MLMGLKDFINTFWKRKDSNKVSDNVNMLQRKQRYEYNTTGLISSFNYDELTQFYYAPRLGQPRNVDLSLVREFAKSHWVQMCIRPILNAIRSSTWEIIPVDEEVPIKDTETFERIKNFYTTPNSDGDDISSVNVKIARDYLEVGEGVVNKIFSIKDVESKSFKLKYNKWSKDKDNKTAVFKGYMFKEVSDISAPTSENGTLLEIRAADSASFLKMPNEYGQYPRDEPVYFQYNWKRLGGSRPRPFFYRELAWMVNNISTYMIYGLAPILTVMLVLETLCAGTRSNKKIFENGSIPDAVVSLMTKNPDEVNQFTDYLKDRFKNNPHKIMVLGADHKFTSLNLNNRDMEWLDGQKFYKKLVMAVFNVTDDELGFSEGGRAVGQGQSRVFIREAVKPVFKELEDVHNKFVVPEFYDGEKPECKFKLSFEDEFEKNIERQNDGVDLDKGVLTVNEVRKKRGLEPVSWGDEPNNKQASMSDDLVRSRLDENRGLKDDNKKGFRKDFSISMEVLKTKSIRELNEIIKYGEGLVKDNAILVLKELKERLSGSVVEVDDLNYNSLESYVDKTFNEVLDGFKSSLVKHKVEVLNGNVAGVIASMSIPLALIMDKSRKGLGKSVKTFVNDGVENAEKMTSTNLLFSTDVDEYVKSFSNQVVDGYVVPDGSTWSGLKGVGDELSSKVSSILEEGVIAGKGIREMRDEIVEFTNMSKSRALTIARNEATRIMQESQLLAIKSAGFSGLKKFVAQIDNRTSDICKRMNGQIVPISADFVDTETGSSSRIAKMHVNCFDEQTEVLTSDGWKFFKEVKGNELILSVNLEKGNSEWVKIKEKIEYIVNENISFYKSNSLNLMTTKNHNHVVKFRYKNKGRSDAGKWLLIEDNILPNYDYSFLGTIPDYKGEDISIIRIGENSFNTNDFVEFLGYYLSEGNTTERKYNTTYIQIVQNKNRYYDKMLDCAKRLFNKIYECKDRFYVVLKSKENKELIEWFKKLGHAKDKYIPTEIKCLDKKYLRIFLDAYLLGDGSVKKGKFWKGYQFNSGKMYFTISDKLASDIGELILKLGKGVSYKKDKDKMCKFKNGTYYCHGVWRIYEKTRPNPSREYLKKEDVFYEGKVYDVELEKNHTLFVRREGKVVCSGNCRSSYVLVEPDEVI